MERSHLANFLVAVLASAFLGSGVTAAMAQTTSDSRSERVEEEVAPATPAAKAHHPAPRAPQSRVAKIALGAISPSEHSARESMLAPNDGVSPVQIGLRRDIPDLASASALSALLLWSDADAAPTAAISVSSPGAVAIRLGLLIHSMPEDSTLRFYSRLSGQQEEVPVAAIMKSISLNLASGEVGERARTYWSPYIDGSEVTLEIILPEGAEPGETRFAIPVLSHFFASPLETGNTGAKGIGTSDFCHIDSTCHIGTWGSQSRATAKMTFVVDGISYLCSGTLMNDTVTTSFIPYFLSAYHCFSTQTVASTLNTFWFYRSTSCNSGILDSSASVRLSGGATLLYSNRITDTLFVRLNDPAPAGSVLSGWSAALPALFDSVTGVHHPDGDLQKISFGQIIDYSDCISATGNTFSCSGVSATEADYFKVRYDQGSTQGGSSGSGLWVTQDGSRYLVGQLRGGSGSCSSPPPTKYYGRFDRAYVAALRNWLNPDSANYTLSVARSGSGSGTVTSSIAGIQCGTDCSESYPSGTTVLLVASPSAGSVFAGWSGACTGTGNCQVTMSSSRSVTATFTACNFAFSPSSVSMSAAGGSGSIAVTTSAGCAWTAGRVESWLTASGSGNGGGTFSYTVAPNTNSLTRSGSLTAGGRTISVIQAGATGTSTTTNAIGNGGFENGAAGWIESSPAGTVIFSSTAEARSGSGYAWLGGYVSGTDVLSQNVTIAADATQASFQFWYRIGTNETATVTAFDSMTVRVIDPSTGSILTTLVTLSNLHASSVWRQSSAFDLIGFRGRTVRIEFRATNDGSNITSFRLDDIVLSVTSASSAAPNYTSLWWNPAESGWGLNLVHQGDTIFGSLFTYDSTGAPMWLFMSNGARQPGTATYSGRLYRAFGPPFNASPFRPITAANLTDVGSMTLEFAGIDSATLTYTMNGVRVAKAIQRQVFGSRAANCLATTASRSTLTNYQDLWWNPDESGWGLNLTHQDNVIFGSLFNYGLDGVGVWYFMSAGIRQADGSYRGELYRATGPSFDAQPFRPISPANLSQVGVMEIRFSDGENAVLTYSVNGITVVKSIVRQVFASPATACN